jgi:hypothetical protein
VETAVSEEKREIKQVHRQDAKELMRLLYDKGFLCDDISREGLDALEDYMAFIMQSRVEGHIAGEKLMKSIRDMGARGKSGD